MGNIGPESYSVFDAIKQLQDSIDIPHAIIWIHCKCNELLITRAYAFQLLP